MIQRSALMLKAKAEFLLWIKSSDETGDLEELTLEQLDEDRNVYLLHTDELEDVEGWLKRNFETLLEFELEDWTQDQTQWPEELSRDLFDRFFDVEVHSVVIDTVGGTIEADDEIEDRQ